MVTADASDIGTGRGSMSEGGVHIMHGKYLHIPIRLYGEGANHTTTYNPEVTVAYIWIRKNDTQREDVE